MLLDTLSDKNSQFHRIASSQSALYEYLIVWADYIRGSLGCLNSAGSVDFLLTIPDVTWVQCPNAAFLGNFSWLDYTGMSSKSTVLYPIDICNSLSCLTSMQPLACLELLHLQPSDPIASESADCNWDFHVGGKYRIKYISCIQYNIQYSGCNTISFLQGLHYN